MFGIGEPGAVADLKLTSARLLKEIKFALCRAPDSSKTFQIADEFFIYNFSDKIPAANPERILSESHKYQILANFYKFRTNFKFINFYLCTAHET